MCSKNLSGSMRKIQLIVFLILTQLATGGVSILYKLAVDDGMKIYILVVYRLVFATFFIAPLALILERKTRTEFTWITACQGIVSGLLGSTLGSNLYAESLVLTSATYASSMINLILPLTLIMSVIFRLERLDIQRSSGKAKVLGTALGLFGAMVLTLYKGISINPWHTKFNLLHSHHHHAETYVNSQSKKNYFWGSILALLSCISYSAWMVLQTKLSQNYPCYSSTALTCFTGTVMSAFYAFARQKHWDEWKLGFDIRLLASAYSGIIGSAMVIAITTWGTSVKGPLYVTSFTPLSLVFVAVLGSILLAEDLHLGSLLGSVLIILGLYVVLWGKSKETAEMDHQADQSEKTVESNLGMITMMTTSCNKIQQSDDFTSEETQSRAFNDELI